MTLNLSPDLKLAIAIVIFTATYAVVAIGKIPVYRIDRAGAALVGASLMVGLGVLSADEAYRAIDFNTITLLLGMMIVVANLRVSGFFRLVNHWVAAHVHHPLTLLIAIVLVTGLLSAFLVNDTICLVMTPLVLDLVLRLKRDPLPYLLAIAMTSNIGSVATITGNPQNMIIGNVSQLPYWRFTATLAPVALAGLVIATALIAFAYRREFFSSGIVPQPVTPPRYHGPLLIKTVIVMAIMVVLFFSGFPVATVAIVGGAVLLLTRRVKPEKIYIEIDWPLLVMFAGLFIVIGGLEKTALTPDVIAAVARLHLENGLVLGAVTAVLSNIVSNVPAVLVLKPFVAQLQDPAHAWLLIAMAATFAGNFTLVGSVANLIVARRAENRGVRIGFWPYFRLGAPLTVITIAIGLYWI